MIWLVAAFVAAGTIDVVFLPDAPEQPAIVVTLEQEGARRALSFAVLTAPPLAGSLVDDGGAPRSLLPLPQAPAGASLVERNGSYIITIDDAGPWAAAFPGAGQRGRSLPVAQAQSLRLVVAAGDGAADGEVIGAGVRASGKAYVTSTRPAATAVLRAGRDVFAGAGAAIDSTAACGRVVPTAVALPSTKLSASEPPTCAGPLAVVRVTGVRIEPKRETPVVGVVLAR
jgi:hypothetical protein